MTRTAGTLDIEVQFKFHGSVSSVELVRHWSIDDVILRESKRVPSGASIPKLNVRDGSSLIGYSLDDPKIMHVLYEYDEFTPPDC
jgi:hypothetical protein